MNVPELKAAEIAGLFRALGRATIRPFNDMDWQGLAGAVGEAQMVFFHQDDLEVIKAMFQVEHWPNNAIVAVIDDTGLTLNGMHTSYGLQVAVPVQIDPVRYDVYSPDEEQRIRRIAEMEERLSLLIAETNSNNADALRAIVEYVVDDPDGDANEFLGTLGTKLRRRR